MVPWTLFYIRYHCMRKGEHMSIKHPLFYPVYLYNYHFVVNSLLHQCLVPVGRSGFLSSHCSNTEMVAHTSCVPLACLIVNPHVYANHHHFYNEYSSCNIILHSQSLLPQNTEPCHPFSFSSTPQVAVYGERETRK